MHGFGAAVWPGSERPYDEPWEARVFALSTLVGAEGLGKGSGRFFRERMDPEHYLRASYYERWLWSTERRLEASGAIAPHDVDAWIDRLRAGERTPSRIDPELKTRTVERIRQAHELRRVAETRFVVEDRVRVKRMRPAGHTRCPRYVRGAEGVVEHIRGIDVFPDVGPYQGPPEPVYSVAFQSVDLFGASDDGLWRVLLDLFESYLEPA